MAQVTYKPQGTAADCIDLQAAINQAGAGGRVDLLQGRVTIRAPVNINVPLTFAGAGAGTQFVRMAGFKDTLLQFGVSRGIVARDFSIEDAPSADVKNADVHSQAMSLYKCTDSVVENVQVYHGFRSGIIVAGCDGVTLDRCVVEDCNATPLPPTAGGKGGHGITVFGSDTDPCRNVKISRCTLRRNWRTGCF